MFKKIARIVAWILGGLVMAIGLFVGGYIINNLTYFGRNMRAVWGGGFVEKQVVINGDMLNYAEGPNNGPPLLLVHGQAVDWQSYARVLPELSNHYHVFVVDCYGHGASAQAPEKYSAVAMGSDLSTFIETVIGEPAVVAGHSSGGLLATWLAANEPEWVRGVVLEDPPLFTTLLPRAESTWNYVALAATTHEFLESGEDDFIAYNIEHSKLFELFQGLQPKLVSDALAYHAEHPGEPVVIYYLPPSINEVFRGFNSYDPRFGQAFYDGSWDEGFDHAAALEQITAPAVLIHANWSYDEEGILMAAMDAADAEQARSLIDDVEFVRVDSGHGFHFEKPQQYIEILVDFKGRLD